MQSVGCRLHVFGLRLRVFRPEDSCFGVGNLGSMGSPAAGPIWSASSRGAKTLAASGLECSELGFGVLGLGFRVWGVGFGVQGVGFVVWGLGSGVWVWGFGSKGLGCRLWGVPPPPPRNHPPPPPPPQLPPVKFRE